MNTLNKLAALERKIQNGKVPAASCGRSDEGIVADMMLLAQHREDLIEPYLKQAFEKQINQDDIASSISACVCLSNFPYHLAVVRNAYNLAETYAPAKISNIVSFGLQLAISYYPTFGSDILDILLDTNYLARRIDIYCSMINGEGPITLPLIQKLRLMEATNTPPDKQADHSVDMFREILVKAIDKGLDLSKEIITKERRYENCLHFIVASQTMGYCGSWAGQLFIEMGTPWRVLLKSPWVNEQEREQLQRYAVVRRDLLAQITQQTEHEPAPLPQM